MFWLQARAPGDFATALLQQSAWLACHCCTTQNQFQKMRIAFLVSNHCPTVVNFQRSHSPVFCKSKHGHAPEEEDEASESLPAAGWAMSRGMFFRCSRMLSVSPPSPMEVKKLMLKRILRGVSCKHVCMCLSRCVQCS